MQQKHLASVLYDFGMCWKGKVLPSGPFSICTKLLTTRYLEQKAIKDTLYCTFFMLAVVWPKISLMA